jgi:AcrR family transcriptional regulator
MPTSRRERPAKPALTRAGIIAVAVEVLRAEGLEKVTMRRLAQELDTGAASLYVYVRNTAELHAAVLDELLGEVDLAVAGDWRARLTGILQSYTMVLFRYPSLARSALVSWPTGEHFLAVVEALLAALDDGLVPAERAAWGVDLLLLHATATAVEHGTRKESLGGADEWEAMSTAVLRVSPAQFPHLASLSTEMLSGPGGGRMAWGFDVLINGILHTPLP